MDSRRLFKIKIVMALLSSVVVANVVALFVYSRIDNVVHVSLYGYGLQFSDEWAAGYWSNYKFFLGSLESALILLGLALGALYFYSMDEDELSRWIGILSSAIAGGCTLLSAYFVFNIDWVVNNTLYQYGLQFDLGWAGSYWLITRATIALTVVSALISIGIAVFTWFITFKKRKIGRVEKRG